MRIKDAHLSTDGFCSQLVVTCDNDDLHTKLRHSARVHGKHQFVASQHADNA